MEKVLELLNNKNIEYEIIYHDPVYTIEEMQQLNLKNVDHVVKNLFVRDDKKQNYYLIVVRQDKRVDLNNLRKIINSRRLSFASENDLDKFLGLEKGAVTPFGILNDLDKKVKVIFDKDVIDLDFVGVHPNVNTATVYIKVNDLFNLIKELGNEIDYVEI